MKHTGEGWTVQDTLYYHFTQQKSRQLIMEYLRRKILKVDELITHRFSYKQAPELYAMLGKAKDADCDRKEAVNRDMVGVLIEWRG